MIFLLQILMDVNDFVEGCIIIKLISSTVISVEGYIELMRDGVSTIFTFKRYFKISKSLNKSSIMADITKDGVLMIQINEGMMKMITGSDQPNLKQLKDFDLPSSKSVSAIERPDFEPSNLAVQKIDKFFDNPKYEPYNSKLMAGVRSVLNNKMNDNSLDDLGLGKDFTSKGFAKYRALRKLHFRADTQVAVLIQDQKYFKVIYSLIPLVYSIHGLIHFCYSKFQISLKG